MTVLNLYDRNAFSMNLENSTQHPYPLSIKSFGSTDLPLLQPSLVALIRIFDELCLYI